MKLVAGARINKVELSFLSKCLEDDLTKVDSLLDSVLLATCLGGTRGGGGRVR